MEISLRVGLGYDVHRLVAGRRLVLGGVTIPHTHGLLGHSDADVLIHAVMDAVLGAAGLGDIGRHFPDHDAEYRGISSLDLLKQVHGLLDQKCCRIVNLDVTIMAQAPPITPHAAAMQRNIGRAISLQPHRINIKATTTEGLGFVGRGEGMAAQCVALVQTGGDTP